MSTATVSRRPIRSTKRSARTRVKVLATGDVPAPIEMADADALEASLAQAGIVADPVAATAETDVTAAAAPYRQADGAYRFANRLRYWILAP